MKIRFITKFATILLALVFAHITSLSGAVIISNFGSSITSADLQGGWVSAYNSTTSTLTNASDMTGGIIDVSGPSISSLAGLNKLSLTAAVTSNPGTTFTIRVYDTFGKTATSIFTWADFGSTSTVVTADLNRASGFTDSSILGWELAPGGSGSTPLTVTFSDLSAVPEPSAILLLGAAMSGLALCRVARRKA